MLLVTARVVKDHEQGAWPWLSELESHLNSQGFGHPDSLAFSGENDWSLQIVTDYPSSLAPQWVALRTGQAGNGTPQHLVLCALDLPAEWVDVARRDGQVAVVLGPCTTHWDIAPVPGELMDELDDLTDEATGWHCGCQPPASRTFSPLAAVLPTRVTPELQYLEAKFAGLVSAAAVLVLQG